MGRHKSNENQEPPTRWEPLEPREIRLYLRSRELENDLINLDILWGLLEEIDRLMQTVRVYVTLVVKMIFSGFSEFPNSMRPPCTTMPWTIWPALVVLWGVCWMFHTPPNSGDAQQLHPSLQDTEWEHFSSAGT